MPSKVTQGLNMEEDSVLEPIAICGMGCRLPGGVDSDSSFWNMLTSKRTGQTPRVPESRFNIDGVFHKNLDRPGSINVMGGYFLDGKPHDFDPSFFNMTPIEAQWLDPQQRKMLEMSYECLSSAGVTMDGIAGTNTAVFVGCFTADYQQMSTRDADFRHNYVATGVDPGIISNRIGHAFNLHGPSFTINTACSSSVYALHNASHALRSRDCDGAIVGGVNLILTVDQHMNTAKLGILSPTSTCHTFDASADGYGRGEAAGALYIKRLSDAIRDGNPIRGVIRSTAVNTNGKVEGMGITHPSMEGQERVLRTAYKKAGLNPDLTAYAELHGTGTPVGDPIEVQAVSKAMNDTRPKDKPLIIGAVKPNIGHSEAASGIFAVMKASLMTESALIPGVALLDRLNPAILEKEWHVKVQKDTAAWPSDSLVRRASVSSFGYGGTNGHVIVEAVESLYPWYQHAKPRKEAAYDHTTKKPVLVTFSAHDKATLLRNIAATKEVADKYYLADLAHTLNLHRTQLASRAFAIASEGHVLSAFAKESLKIGAVIKKKLNDIGFLFTGQGAQWAGMAREAMLQFPFFMETIKNLDLVLARLTAKPTFSIADLLTDDSAQTASLINEASVAQPLCTAIQIAIVDLLESWGVEPTVSVGHSSGEIAAAYSAGLISAPHAILAAFCRGLAVEAKAGSGSMLAVGLGTNDVHKYVSSYKPSEICIACENSPSSVTLSGQPGVIAHVQKTITADGIFARELRTGRAYHSPHMGPVGDYYDDILEEALVSLTEDDLDWRRQRSHFVSSVTGEVITGELPHGYFSDNLRNTVLFDTAVRLIGNDKDKLFSQLGSIVEIGPHSALAGPFKQICIAESFDRFTYIPTLARNKCDAVQLLSTAGSLFNTGYPVKLAAVNDHIYGDENGLRNPRKQKTQYLLVDLPPYQWNYEKEYWSEPRPSIEQRGRVFPRHDLLGSRISGLTSQTRVWRNVLRHRDVPWLKHHSLGGSAIFPAAGHLAAAIEALWQVHQEQGLPFDGVALRDVAIDKALALPENEEGVEVVISLSASSSGWYSFSVESLSNGEWVLHSQGSVSAAREPSAVQNPPVDRGALSLRATGKTWYEAFRRVGFNYGESFQQIKSVQTDTKVQHAAGDVVVMGNSGVMEDESRYLIHPSTVDACFQLIIVSIHAGKHKEMPWGVVPTHLEEIKIFPAGIDAGSTVEAVAWTDGVRGRQFNTNTVLTSSQGRPLVQVKNLTCVAYEAAIPASNLAKLEPAQPFSQAVWKPDITALTEAQFEQMWPQLTTPLEREAKLFELISHRQALNDVCVVCGSTPLLDNLDSVFAALPRQCSISLVLYGSVKESQISEAVRASTSVRELQVVSELWEDEDGLVKHDLVLVDLDPAKLPAMILSQLKSDSWLLGSSVQRQTFFSKANHHGYLDGETSVLCVAQQFCIHKVKAGSNSHIGLNGVRGHGESNGVNGINGHHNTNGIKGSHETKAVNGVNGTHGMNGGAMNGAVMKATKTTGPSSGKDLEKVTVLNPTISEAAAKHKSLLAIAEDHLVHKHLASFDQDTDKLIVIDDTAGEVLSSMNTAKFDALKAITASGLPAVWLTCGVNEGKCPSGGLAAGFLRVVRSEQAGARFTLLDVDEGAGTEKVIKAVRDQLHAANTREPKDDTEFWLHQGSLHIARVYPNTELNRSWHRDSTDFEYKLLPQSKTLKASLLDGNVVFEHQEATVEKFLAGNETLIQIQASELLTTQGGYGVAVGSIESALCSDVVGKRVVAIVRDQFQTMVRTSEFAVINKDKDNLSPESIVALMAPCIRLAGLTSEGPNNIRQKEKVILLHAPRALTYMTALIAKREGWELVVAAESAELKKQYISSPVFAGVEVLGDDSQTPLSAKIQNHTGPKPATAIAYQFSTLGQEVWRNLPGCSRFYLLLDNKTSMDIVPDAAPFARGASFIPLSQNCIGTDTLLVALNLISGLEAEHVEVVRDLAHVEDVSKLSTATWTASSQQSQQLQIARCDYTKSHVKVMRERETFRLSGNDAYLMIGCLGGLGRSLIKFMMEHGAKNFAFVSRSGEDSPQAARTVKLLGQAGASATVFRADASDHEAVQAIVSQVSAGQRIGGVVHAAMVLKDGIIENMNVEAFNEAVKPKFQGAWALHHAVKDLDIDFFVMTSSISATLGNPGQSNYSAANSFLDALAAYRNQQGLPATSLVLPMVLDVGVVAENDAIEASLARKGLYGVDEQQMLRGFEAAMSQRQDPEASRLCAGSQIIMGMDVNELADATGKAGGVGQADVYWYLDARFCHVRASIEQRQASFGAGGGDVDDSFAVVLQSALAEGKQAALEVIAWYIAKRVSSILMIPEGDFELKGRSVASYGLDSMIGAEMRTWLFNQFGLDFPFQKLLASTLTFLELASQAGQSMGVFEISD